MGWCSGTQIFDEIVSPILKFDDLNDEQKKGIIKVIIIAFENADWDCETDSWNFNDKRVLAAFQELYPLRFKDE